MQRTAIITVLPLLILACAALSPSPTPTAIPTATTIPTNTPTITPRPTKTLPAPSETADPLVNMLPEGTPASDWKGIPIMPGATSGKGDETSYIFTIQASREHITEFYVEELHRLGWESFATGEGDEGISLLFFRKGDKMLTLSITDHDGQEMIVMILVI
jgi:hypothetical protein